MSNTDITPTMVDRLALAHFRKHQTHFILIGRKAANKELDALETDAVTDRASHFVDELRRLVNTLFNQ